MKSVSWREFEPTKFVYAFFNFNTIYQVDWENSIDKKEILSYEKIIDKKKGNERNLREDEQQVELLCFILNQIDFSTAQRALSKVLNSLQRDGIDVIKELEKITPCPAPVCYPSWNASVFVKVIGLSLEKKLAFSLNSTGVKYPSDECGRSVL